MRKPKTQEQRDFEAKKRKLIRHQRKEEGLCPSCGKPLNLYNTYCDSCTEKRKAYNKRYLESIGGATEYYKSRYAKQKAEGICTGCGRRKARPGFTLCTECSLRRRRREQQKAREKGVMPINLRGNGDYCAICIKPVEVKGEKLCNRCKQRNIEKSVIAREIKRKRKVNEDVING